MLPTDDNSAQPQNPTLPSFLPTRSSSSSHPPSLRVPPTLPPPMLSSQSQISPASFFPTASFSMDPAAYDVRGAFLPFDAGLPLYTSNSRIQSHAPRSAARTEHQQQPCEALLFDWSCSGTSSTPSQTQPPATNIQAPPPRHAVSSRIDSLLPILDFDFPDDLLSENFSAFTNGASSPYFHIDTSDSDALLLASPNLQLDSIFTDTTMTNRASSITPPVITQSMLSRTVSFTSPPSVLVSPPEASMPIPTPPHNYRRHSHHSHGHHYHTHLSVSQRPLPSSRRESAPSSSSRRDSAPSSSSEPSSTVSSPSSEADLTGASSPSQRPLDFNGKPYKNWTGRKYKCNHCDKIFLHGELESYAQHISEMEAVHGVAHVNRKFKCPEPTCLWHQIGFTRKLESQKHYTRKHGKPKIACPFWKPSNQELYSGAKPCATRWHADTGSLTRHLSKAHGVKQSLKANNNPLQPQ